MVLHADGLAFGNADANDATLLHLSVHRDDLLNDGDLKLDLWYSNYIRGCGQHTCCLANNVSIAAQSFVGDEASSNTADVWLTEEITLCANLVYDGVIYEPTEEE